MSVHRQDGECVGEYVSDLSLSKMWDDMEAEWIALGRPAVVPGVEGMVDRALAQFWFAERAADAHASIRRLTIETLQEMGGAAFQPEGMSGYIQ